MRHHSAVVLLSGLFVVAGAEAATRLVPAQYPSIQAAINASLNGDEVVVSPGTYLEDIDFLGKDVTVRSVDGPDVTIIDATGQSNSVVTFDSGEDNGAKLIGFTLRNGIGRPGSPRLGGGIYIDSSSPVIQDCIIRNNTAGNGGGIYAFGALSGLRITNCLIIKNEAVLGGGLYNHFSNPVLRNCTIANNSALPSFGPNSGGAIYNFTSSTGRVANGIVWGNVPDQFISVGNLPITTYSIVEGGFPGVGNLNANPLFTNPTINDYRPLPGSPAIDSADSTEVADTLFRDLDDLPRGADDPAKPDTGVPVFGLVVDMGPYERHVAAVVTCPGDITGDDVIDFQDLLMLLSLWGACP